MSAPARVQPLAGLVSSAAEALFVRLRAAGPSPIGSATQEVDLDNSAAAELLDAGIALRCGTDRDNLRALDQAVALRLLLERRQAELINAQRRIIEGWNRLTALLPAVVAGGDTTAPTPGMSSMSSSHQMMIKTAELCTIAKRQLRGTDPGGAAYRMRDRVRTAATEARRRLIVQPDCSGLRAASVATELGRGRNEVRVRSDLPVHMLHVDEPIGSTSCGSPLARFPPVPTIRPPC